MTESFFEVRRKGKPVRVPSILINDLKIIALGKWFKTTSVHDEVWTKGQVVEDPEGFIGQLKAHHFKADIFTFIQKLPETQPKYRYFYEWDNVAAIPLSSFKDWWENRLPQVTRKNVRRSAKRGVVVHTVELNDELIQGITDIYNEIPFRQGKRFPHFGKDFETVKIEVSTLMDRSEFIGAYHGNELIGFIKLVHMGPISSILHIVSKNKHYDKRPTNALITKAVELSLQRGASYLVYGNYIYGNKINSPLAEFKRRNGFVQVNYPRYYAPLSLKGKIVIGLRLHKGLLGLLPPFIISLLWNIRARIYQRKTSLQEKTEDRSAKGKENNHQDE